MLLVFAGHFRDSYFRGSLDEATARALEVLTKIATPAFLLISGMMIGFLHAGREEDARARARARLADRALFLLVVARPFIALAHVPRSGWHCFNYVYVTDTIAVCVLAGCFFVPRMGARARAFLGALLIGLTWVAIPLWNPPLASLRRVLKDVVFGFERADSLLYTFPLLPWLGVYLMGSCLGDRLGRSPPGASARTFFLTGAAATATALAAKVAWWMRPHDAGVDGHSLLTHLTSPLQKEPPGPAYLAFYGGIALVLVAALLALEARGRLAAPRRALAVLGRASLFAFVVQYYVYYVGLYLLHPRPSGTWPIVLAGSIGFLWALAALWIRRDCNRFFTLGLSPLPRRG
jgi:uncharacterized membrane protein